MKEINVRVKGLVDFGEKRLLEAMVREGLLIKECLCRGLKVKKEQARNNPGEALPDRMP